MPIIDAIYRHGRTLFAGKVILKKNQPSAGWPYPFGRRDSGEVPLGRAMSAGKARVADPATRDRAPGQASVAMMRNAPSQGRACATRRSACHRWFRRSSSSPRRRRQTAVLRAAERSQTVLVMRRLGTIATLLPNFGAPDGENERRSSPTKPFDAIFTRFRRPRSRFRRFRRTSGVADRVFNENGVDCLANIVLKRRKCPAQAAEGAFF